MKITEEDANRLCILFEEINERLWEFKDICRMRMTPSEYEQFKYRTLAQIEPAIREDSDLVTRYSSIDSLESIAMNAMDDLVCEKCGRPLDANEHCEC